MSDRIEWGGRAAIGATCLAALLLCAPAAHAATCGNRDQIVEKLFDQDQQLPIARAMNRNKNIIEFLVSHKTRTWTAIMTTPHGCTYMLDAGEFWEDLEPVVRGISL